MESHISFPGCGFLRKLELTRKPKQSSEHESSKISYYGNTIGKTNLFFYTMGFDKKLIELNNPHNSQIWQTSSHRFPNVCEYFFAVYGK